MLAACGKILRAVNNAMQTVLLFRENHCSFHTSKLFVPKLQLGYNRLPIYVIQG